MVRYSFRQQCGHESEVSCPRIQQNDSKLGPLDPESGAPLFQSREKKYMLFSGWEVRIVKNCDRGFLSPRSQFYTIRTDRKPVNNLFIFFQVLTRKINSQKKSYASVTVTVVRDRKIRTALRTNQIVGFVTVPTWKKWNKVFPGRGESSVPTGKTLIRYSSITALAFGLFISLYFIQKQSSTRTYLAVYSALTPGRNYLCRDDFVHARSQPRDLSHAPSRVCIHNRIQRTEKSFHQCDRHCTSSCRKKLFRSNTAPPISYKSC